MTTPSQSIAIAAISESPLNARKDFDPVALGELASSIKAKGVLEPVMVRPLKAAGRVVPGKYELIFGHRRLRAAKKAGLDEVPAIVREADDNEVPILQDAENHQRVNLHALERSAAHLAMKARGMSLEQIAKDTSTSEATVRDSLKVGDLVPAAMTAFREGKIDFSKAIIIAKVPAKLQPEILKWTLTVNDRTNDLPSSRLLKDVVDREYILDLKKAQFDTKDAMLVPAAGACTNCEKRTGAQPGLFEGYKPDLCTDRPCNDSKTEAALAKMGSKVLPLDEVRDVFHDFGQHVKHDSDYVLATETSYEDPKRRELAELVGPEAAKKLEVVARAPSGQIVKLFNKKAAAAAVKKAGLISEAKKEAEQKSKARDQKRQAKAANVDTKEIERKEDFEESIKNALAGALVAAFEKEGASAKALRFLLERLVSLFYCTALYERRGLKVGIGREALEKAFAKHFGAAKPDVLMGVFFEALFTDNTDDEERAELLVDAGELLKVNLKKIEIDLREADFKERAKVSEAKDAKAAKKGKAA